MLLLAAAAAAVAGVAYAGTASAAVNPNADMGSDPGIDPTDGADPSSDSSGGFDIASIFGGAFGGGGNMQLSDAGLQAIADREGFSATPYWDHKGYSIGYGHLMTLGENYTSVTQDQARALLLQDAAIAVRAVNSSVSVSLTQNQFDALVSFAYNVGVGAFKSSTLVKLLNQGDYADVGAQLARWNQASGAVSAALVARRQSEAQQFYA